jgi:flagellar biogenesis protein FliO
VTEILQPVAAVTLVLTLLGGLLYVLRKRGLASFSGMGSPSPFSRSGNLRQLKVMEKIPLGGQHALHLVRVGDRVILVATAPGSCQMMDTALDGAALSNAAVRV